MLYDLLYMLKVLKVMTCEHFEVNLLASDNKRL